MKKTNQKTNQEIKKTEVEQSQLDEKNLILQKTDELVFKPFTDAELDISNEKQLLLFPNVPISPKRKIEDEQLTLVGGETTTIKDILIRMGIIGNKIEDYEPKFPKEWYNKICDLQNKMAPRWPQKHPVTINATVELIYGRLPREVLQVLRKENPYMPGQMIRYYKHFQLFTKDYNNRISKYIDDSLKIMNKSMSWHEFRVRYYQEYGVPFQSNLFEPNSYN